MEHRATRSDLLPQVQISHVFVPIFPAELLSRSDEILLNALSTSVDDHCVDGYREMIRIYHEIFVANLSAELRDQQAWPLAETFRLFKLAVLDYMRWALAYRLVEETPAAMKRRAEQVGDLRFLSCISMLSIVSDLMVFFPL
jgi:hypothetical protein